jgi:hypothetical protein
MWGCMGCMSKSLYISKQSLGGSIQEFYYLIVGSPSVIWGATLLLWAVSFTLAVCYLSFSFHKPIVIVLQSLIQLQLIIILYYIHLIIAYNSYLNPSQWALSTIQVYNNPGDINCKIKFTLCMIDIFLSQITAKILGKQKDQGSLTLSFTSQNFNLSVKMLSPLLTLNWCEPI